MKTAQDIVRSLQVQPQFRKLQHQSCIHKILSMFLPSTQRFVEFCYIKNSTLFIVLSHNAGKQELDNNIKMIKDVLNQITPSECQELKLSDIKAFVTHKPRKKKKEQIADTVPWYQERSQGLFDTNYVENESLRSLFDSIRKIIQKRKNA